MKKTLNESTIRKFMKLANIEALSENFVDNNIEEAHCSKRDDEDAMEEAIEESDETLEEAEETLEETEETSEGMGHAYGRDDEDAMEEGTHEDAPSDEMSDVSPDTVEAIVDAIADELESETRKKAEMTERTVSQYIRDLLVTAEHPFKPITSLSEEASCSNLN